MGHFSRPAAAAADSRAFLAALMADHADAMHRKGLDVRAAAEQRVRAVRPV